MIAVWDLRDLSKPVFWTDESPNRAVRLGYAGNDANRFNVIVHNKYADLVIENEYGWRCGNFVVWKESNGRI